ncbi:MAG: CDP-diacylglycerol--glycerol-3-phosphate 3-phosphatidyltransferase [Oscillospiraceae bacterium]|nr:CDP-diacylglycerol--glycerol-3-phosphate 3-phosphatidyltransferase [Candidatus Equicaccousia limihippi]
MTLPNKLTLTRIIVTPIFLLCLCIPFPHNLLVALILFIGASITDGIDGNYARKHGLVTDFGKFLDPLADKMLTTAAFLGFLYQGWGTGIVYVTFIILFREFLVFSLRLTAVSSGNAVVIAANFWGKLKTVVQMVAIIAVITFEYLKFLDARYFDCAIKAAGNGAIFFATDLFCDIALWISAALTVISGVIYLVQNKKFINPKK